MRIGILGDIQVLKGETAAAVPGAKQRALLALLALHAGTTLSDDRILDELWADSLPDNPANALQKRVSELRKIVGSERLYRRLDGYVLDVPRGDVDALDFEDRVTQARHAMHAGWAEDASRMLHEALALWRGEALVEFADLPFARLAASRLEELRWSAIEDRMEVDLALGRHDELAGELRTLVAEQPLRERLVGQLMLASYRAGRQADALHVYAEARERLAEELGLDPGPKLRALELAILNQDPQVDAPAPSVRREPRHNLPAAVNSFVGRETEHAHILRLVAGHRLVTLTGPGGIGKTRLALEVGRELAEVTSGGVWLVELAPIGDPVGVVAAVALAVGARDTGGAAEPPLRRLLDRLADRSVIVLLDNCEHLLDAAASVVAAVLTRCPGVRIIATSREPLTVSGEALLPVPPLGADAAVRLFAERAEAVRPDFAIDDRTTGQVDDLCGRLDRLPLAIELAAARVRTLPVAQIATRLQDRFRLLTTGPRDADERHRTLRAAVKWSYDLLFEHEKAAFQQLAVFPDTFDLPAAEALCATADIAAGDAADVVEHLIDKSLLIERDGRYRMLATLREFGLELLERSGGRERAAAAHAAYFLAHVNQQAHLLYTRDELPWLNSLEQNIDSIRAALAWATEHDPAAGLATIGVLAPSAWVRGHRQEARHVIDTLLALDPGFSPIDRCRALRWGAGLADAAGWTGQRAELARELALGEARSTEAIDLAEQAGDEIELACSLRHHAVSLIRRGTYTGDNAPLDVAGRLLDRAEQLFSKHDDDWGTAITLVTRMFNALGAGQLDETSALCQRAWPTAEAIGERLILERIMFVQALLAEASGDLPSAITMHERALAVSRELKFVEAIALHESQLQLLGASTSAPDRPSPYDLSAAAAARTAGGQVAIRHGDRELAETLTQRATTTYESIDAARIPHP